MKKIIETSDPICAFCEAMKNIDPRKHLAVKKIKAGRKRYSPEILIKEETNMEEQKKCIYMKIPVITLTNQKAVMQKKQNNKTE